MKKIAKVVPPEAIGIIGAGQLGKMLTQEAKRMGYRVIVLDPKPDAPAGQIADEQMVAAFSDYASLERLAMKTKALTYEFEHIDADELMKIEALGYRVYPSAKTLKMIQNKWVQKNTLSEKGIAVADYEPVESVEQLKRFFAKHENKMVIKACRGGYDGKGNWFVRDESEIQPLIDEIGHLPLYVEAFFDFSKEVSVIFAKNEVETVVYPISENTHDEGILIMSMVPARIDSRIEKKVVEVAEKVADALDDYGVFCIECFVNDRGDVVVNEIAPRPHNTGHYTIEACSVSQYEQQLRVMTGMPLGKVTMRSPSVMHNVLGSEGVRGSYKVLGLEEALGLEACYVHLYGKPDTLDRKKMGHVTVLDASLECAMARAIKAVQAIRFVASD